MERGAAIAAETLRRTRVVHVTTVHYALDIRMFYKEARALADAGYEVTAIGPHERDEEVDGICVLALRYYRRRPIRMTLGAARAFLRCLSVRGDVYHFHDPELLPWMALLLLVRPRVIYDMHENLPKAVLTKPWIRPGIRALVSRAIRLAERVLAAGMGVVFAEESYRADYPWARQSAVVQNMPRTAELAEISRPRRVMPTVCYFGSVSAARGSIVTLEALELLARRGLTVEFECVGAISDAHDAELRRLAERLGVQARIHGYTAPPDGWPIVAECHIGLALLHRLPNYVDSYPTKLFEYMALGLPVIASDFPLYRRIVEEAGCGVCVDPLDVEAVATTLERLLSDPALSAAMGRRGREAALAHYNWDNEAARLLEFYGRLLPVPR